MFIRPRKANTEIEFIILFMMVMGAMLVFQNFFGRAIAGRWKSVGDSFGFGRQYSPTKTFECALAQDPNGTNDIWYSVACADSKNCVRWDYDCLKLCPDPKCDPAY